MTRQGYFIRQFMWPYQRSFRISAQVGIGMALSTIGFEGEPNVTLVGFKVAGEHEFDVCVEPEDGPYSPADFARVKARADELYEEHPESEVWYSAAHLHDEKHRLLRDAMRAEAIAEVLQNHPTNASYTFFASRSVRVGDYEVHVVLGVASEALSTVPRLRTTSRDRFYVAPSLVHALIDEMLYRASSSLYMPSPGINLRALNAGTPEIVRSATERLVRSVFVCAGHWFGENADLLLSSISALPYEGRSGNGSILLAKPNDPAIDILLKLQRPVGLDETRAVRKLLEASGSGADLLAGEVEGHGVVYGLGRVSEDYDKASETVFRVSVLGRGAWDLYHAETALLSIRDGVTHLPMHVLDVAQLEDLVDRLLPHADLEVLTGLAKAAGENEHGAMLVISSDAAGEAQRLTPQSWATEPVRVPASMLSQLTAIDGAILIDPQGRCHAIGVILDGRAAGQGDPARGSRFNNAIRYLDTDPPPAIVIVYSADGNTDILPRLHRRVHSEKVVSAVRRYLDLAAARPPKAEELSAARDAVAALRFYLSEEQCRDINAAQAALTEWRDQNGELQIIYPDLEPDPRMNDSYWTS